jgi:predicted ester cyclase
MGQARDAMDRVTEAYFGNDWDAFGRIYAVDAIAITPDAGELKGTDAIVGWSRQMSDAFPDARYEADREFESGNVAIGKNTGPLHLPDGQTIPATGKSVRVRAVDIATVENGIITDHRFYFDQMEFLGQLGLAPDAG